MSEPPGPAPLDRLRLGLRRLAWAACVATGGTLLQAWAAGLLREPLFALVAAAAATPEARASLGTLLLGLLGAAALLVVACLLGLLVELPAWVGALGGLLAALLPALLVGLLGGQAPGGVAGVTLRAAAALVAALGGAVGLWIGRRLQRRPRPPRDS